MPMPERGLSRTPDCISASTVTGSLLQGAAVVEELLPALFCLKATTVESAPKGNNNEKGRGQDSRRQTGRIAQHSNILAVSFSTKGEKHVSHLA